MNFEATVGEVSDEIARQTLEGLMNIGLQLNTMAEIKNAIEEKLPDNVAMQVMTLLTVIEAIAETDAVAWLVAKRCQTSHATNLQNIVNKKLQEVVETNPNVLNELLSAVAGHG